MRRSEPGRGCEGFHTFSHREAWGLEALQSAVNQAAWKSKPSWYLVATDDRMIPVAAQHAMSQRAGSVVAEVPASHSVYVSRPDAVVDLIATAARDARQAGAVVG